MFRLFRSFRELSLLWKPSRIQRTDIRKPPFSYAMHSSSFVCFYMHKDAHHSRVRSRLQLLHVPSVSSVWDIRFPIWVRWRQISMRFIITLGCSPFHSMLFSICPRGNPTYWTIGSGNLILQIHRYPLELYKTEWSGLQTLSSFRTLWHICTLKTLIKVKNNPPV